MKNMRIGVATIVSLGLLTVACTPMQPAPPPPQAVSGPVPKVLPEEVRLELSRDLSHGQDQIRLPRLKKKIAQGPLSIYDEFTTSTRGGAVMSSPADRAEVITTVYPGTVLGTTGKSVGGYLEVGYDYYGQLLTGWVSPDRHGLAAGPRPDQLNEAERQALYRKILDNVNALKKKWQDNQYLSIGGFSINVERSPSVSVDIHYK